MSIDLSRVSIQLKAMHQRQTLCGQEHAKQRSFPLQTGVLRQRFKAAYVQWLCSIQLLVLRTKFCLHDPHLFQRKRRGETADGLSLPHLRQALARTSQTTTKEHRKHSGAATMYLPYRPASCSAGGTPSVSQSPRRSASTCPQHIGNMRSNATAL